MVVTRAFHKQPGSGHISQGTWLLVNVKMFNLKMFLRIK